MKNSRLRQIAATFAFLSGAITSTFAASKSTETTADAFLAAGPGNYASGTDLSANNYGAAGTLAIAPASSAKGEFQSILKFNLASTIADFNTAYGVGNWSIDSITLTLASNFGDQGEQPNNLIFNQINAGGFIIEWLADDSWTEGGGNPSSPSPTGVNYGSLGTLLASSHQIVGTYNYVPPGDNVPVTWTLNLTSGLLADAALGGDVSFLFRAADNSVGYLFNARSFASNKPLITVSAVPEPAAGALILMGAVYFCAIKRYRRSVK